MIQNYKEGFTLSYSIIDPPLSKYLKKAAKNVNGYTEARCHQQHWNLTWRSNNRCLDLWMTPYTMPANHAQIMREANWACNIQTETHLHLVTVEEVDVGFVLLLVLTHQQQHGGIACLVEHRLTHVDGGEREVLQLLLQEHNRRLVKDVSEQNDSSVR